MIVTLTGAISKGGNHIKPVLQVERKPNHKSSTIKLDQHPEQEEIINQNITKSSSTGIKPDNQQRKK
jgi:hypothetical protein